MRWRSLCLQGHDCLVGAGVRCGLGMFGLYPVIGSPNELNDQVLGEFGTSCIYCTGVPYGWTCGGCVYYYDFSDDGRFELQRLLGLLEDFIKRSNTTNMK